MKQKITALLLALALLASLCAASALAEERAKPAEAAAESAGAGEDDSGAAGAEEGTEEPPSPAGPDLADNVIMEPDALGSLSFANVERRMRENNLQILTLEQSVLTLEEMDYEDMYEQLRKQLNRIAGFQWMFAATPVEYLTAAGLADSEYGRDKTHDMLGQSYDALRAQFDAIKNGDMQKDNAGVIRQLNNLEDQTVMAGESLYISLTSMETQRAALERQLAALNRTLEEMELRYSLGQISAMQLSEVKEGRTSLSSGLETLRMNIRNCKLQLEMLVGAGQTGEIVLGALPQVTVKQLEAMDPEADLAAAREKSYELYDAEKALEDARDDYMDTPGYSEDHYRLRAARYAWQAAQYTYNNTVQSYELKFRTLYAQVKDCYQIWEAARVSLACEQSDYAAAQLRHQQGNISQNALLSARDGLSAAEEAVQSAAGDLFATYNTYRWAVQHGILN